MCFLNLYNIYKYRVNKKLSSIINELPFQDNDLLKAMKYSMFSGGKRLRPCLVYGIGKMFKVNMTTLDIISSAIECIHIYSLIHDDLPCMDNDDFRRGRQSCHIKYTEYTALLAGNALHALAFNILSKNCMPGVSDQKRINMIHELSNSIGSTGMCIGQMLDLEKITKFNLSQLKITNLYKTAFLIRLSVRLAYFAAHNFSTIILSYLDVFSISFGLAFQMQDDILDMHKDVLKREYRIEKHNSLKNITVPLKVNLDVLKDQVNKLCDKSFLALNNLQKIGFNITFLKSLIQFSIKDN
ncbi:(2E,6E)-farnesyl diphosphate synthase [Buchnera aphidicola (Hyadaphis tataricae)]|uniref:(2E,6E)-farnesyl diphosphate synthase n=1 Tax=Buchnera aphidicola (Hyadaphis tataricae) TaxID=1241859 RepID=A0A4D6XW70_9GAMM|nr:polyprenyl synthetase family protein [Buchnera aphidicola]QCI21746.1 (2E,6E)-farnesyl diphosphate synthase [Buchnera aphidicola (Hyadaphis tataricae)]